MANGRAGPGRGASRQGLRTPGTQSMVRAFRIPTRAVRLPKTVMPRKDAKRARRAVSARLRWFVAQLMRLFKTTSAELFDRTIIRGLLRTEVASIDIPQCASSESCLDLFMSDRALLLIFALNTVIVLAFVVIVLGYM
jgi:hypothetical protein